MAENTFVEFIKANADLAKKFADVYELVCDLEGQMKQVANQAAKTPSIKIMDALRGAEYTMKLIKYELEKVTEK